MTVVAPTVHPQVTAAKRKLDEHLAKGLVALFASADEMLFQMSEKAAGTDKQSVYFDAMREFRLKKNELQSAFTKSYATEYKKALSPGASSTSAKSNGSAGLSLIASSDLEQSLAVTSMVERAYNANADALFALAQRLGYLLGDSNMDESHVPIGPKPICDGFNDAMNVLDADTATEVRLILFKLFEKSVLKTLPQVYAEINESLVRAGVVPEIKMQVRKSDTASAPARPSQKSAHTSAESGVMVSAEAAQALANMTGLEDVVDVISDISDSPISPAQIDMNMLDTLSHLMQSGAATQAAGATSLAQLTEATQVLVKSLSALQSGGQLSALSDVPKAGGEGYSAALLKELNADEGEVGSLDANTIDIVGMLFEFILDDRNIAGSLRALISKLQLPFLKIALIDKSFFNNYGHPARRLLNELGQAGIGWREGETPDKDPLYKKVEEIVERVLKEFDADVSIFQTLLDDLYGFLEHDNVLAESKEILVERSRNIIKDAIESRLKDVQLHSVVCDLIVGPWRDVLAHIYDSEGVDSEAWVSALKTMDDLIWSVQPRTAQDRGSLVKILPKLLGGLNKGLARLGYEPEKIEALLGALEPMHVACLHGKHAAEPEIESIELSTADGQEEDPETLRKRDAEQAVRGLALGDWVEFTKKDGKTVRGKLVWHDDFLDDYTFVGRTFKVVADKGAAELIRDMLDGRAVRIDNIPLLDRALDAVMMKLRS